jgi:hypothetical protein
MSMSRKNYVAIADTIKRHIDTITSDGGLDRTKAHERIIAIEAIAKDLARDFAMDNCSFQNGRFLAACGVGK